MRTDGSLRWGVDAVLVPLLVRVIGNRSRHWNLTRIGWFLSTQPQDGERVMLSHFGGPGDDASAPNTVAISSTSAVLRPRT